jgi:hypothetical protein
LERNRYPQYDHVAALIAEDTTSRFLNIISLLNGFIPLVAIQLNAIQIGDLIALIFTVILGQRLGLAPEEDQKLQIGPTGKGEARKQQSLWPMKCYDC